MSFTNHTLFSFSVSFLVGGDEESAAKQNFVRLSQRLEIRRFCHCHGLAIPLRGSGR